MMMDYYSLDESMKIAVERNDKFYGFDQTDYKAKDDKEFGEYFYKTIVTKNVEPITPKIKEIFKGIYILLKKTGNV